ncbi:MAG: hypothetical protein RLZZ519_939 [Bacteroidota bacterium]
MFCGWENNRIRLFFVFLISDKETMPLISRILTLLSLFACLNIFTNVLFAQQFTALPYMLPFMEYADAEWGDFDADGDLDLLMAGSNTSNYQGITKLIRNDGSGFTNINANIIGITYGDVDWGDYDNDGDLDIVLSGQSVNSNLVSKIYSNDAGVFQDIQAGLRGFMWASVQWGDFDNDGDLDLVVQGVDSNETASIYRNDNGNFVDIQAGLTGLSLGSIALGDYDADGDLDIFSAGSRWVNGILIYTSNLYRNEEGIFSLVLPSPFEGARRSSAAWGDFDNDGDLDLALTGENRDNIKFSKIYVNHNGNFSVLANLTEPVSWGALSWGDYDNDGDVDLLRCGYKGPNLQADTKVFTNAGGNFSWDTAVVLAPVYLAGANWGDIDNDDDLDIVLVGSTNTYHNSKIYRNNSPIPNSAPDVPSGLTGVSQGGNSIRFEWTAPFDAETPSPGLSYRLWIGTSIDGFEIAAPMADTATGWRRIAGPGNLKGTSWTLRNVQVGQTYFASVSAVDAGLKGSAFSPKISVTAVVAADEPTSQLLLVTAGPNPTNGVITVQTKFEMRSKGHYRLTNMAGQALPAFSGEWNGKLTLDLGGLSAGTYLLLLDSKELAHPTDIRIVKE